MMLGKDAPRPDDVKGSWGGFPDQPILGIDAGFSIEKCDLCLQLSLEIG